MDNGQVAEIDSPLELFKSEGGIFRQMCLKLGISETQIMNIAKGAGEEHQNSTEEAVKKSDVPSIEIRLPTPSMEVDFDALTLGDEGEGVTEIESLVRVRRRSRRGRRGRLEGVYRTSVVESWADSYLGWESFGR